MAKTCQKCGIGNGITGSNQFILVLVGPFHVPTPQRWECSRCRSASRNVECFAGLLVPNLLVGNPICEALLHERDMRRLYLHQNRPICLLGDVSHSGWKLELPKLRSQTGVWEREEFGNESKMIGKSGQSGSAAVDQSVLGQPLTSHTSVAHCIGHARLLFRDSVRQLAGRILLAG